MKLDEKKLNIRAEKISLFCNSYIKEGDRVLDIGCGDGRMILSIKSKLDRNFKISGTDVLEYDVPFNFKKIKDNKLGFHDKEFNVAILNDVLHHIPKEKQIEIIREALRVANKVLIFEVANDFTGKLVDVITNKMHDPRVNLPLTMRNINEWEGLFRNNNINFESFTSKRTLNQLFLLKNYFFVLDSF